MRTIPLKHHAVEDQRGVALIVCLILLLVMTLLGVSAMNSSIMQELMSNSFRTQTATLSSAEFVVREGEQVITGIVTGNPRPDAGYHDLAEDSLDPLDVAAWNFKTQNFDGGEYAIEHIGRREVPGESIAEGEEVAGSHVSIFRISARSEGDRGAARIVQTIFVTLEAP
ncbi:PilX N-terminal domain-containing pilus assembly protein [Aquisalimonas sp.]|uniref:pilus assembly PilX family protein n=1 Tax=Aquisalimonas sp. TaxID=1872621 RepID=UPI0025B9EFCE|nr:PilX N-terminal domain-containing pilus assembly protein [Aquisalimonas sp.]